MNENEIMVKLAEVICRMYFHNRSTTASWMVTPNPNLGGASPAALIALGKTDKLIQFINESLNSNKPEPPEEVEAEAAQVIDAEYTEVK